MAPLTSPIQPDDFAEKSIPEQHEELRGLVEQLPTTRDLALLTAKLLELRAELEIHYAVEEGPEGFYEIVVKRAPRHHTKVQRLFEEHQDILRRIDAIASRSRALAEGPAAEVHRDVADLVRRLDAHEARETEMLGDAMYRDTGFGE